MTAMTSITNEDILWEVLRLTRKLSSDQKLKLSEILVLEAQPSSLEETMLPSKAGRLSDYAGVGADLWQKIDVDKYIAEERASWETSSPQ